MSTKFKNKIPALLRQRGMSITDLHHATKLSYQLALELGSEKYDVMADTKQVGNLRRICEALNVTPNDLIEL